MLSWDFSCFLWRSGSLSGWGVSFFPSLPLESSLSLTTWETSSRTIFAAFPAFSSTASTAYRSGESSLCWGAPLDTSFFPSSRERFTAPVFLAFWLLGRMPVSMESTIQNGGWLLWRVLTFTFASAPFPSTKRFRGRRGRMALYLWNLWGYSFFLWAWRDAAALCLFSGIFRGASFCGDSLGSLSSRWPVRLVGVVSSGMMVSSLFGIKKHRNWFRCRHFGFSTGTGSGYVWLNSCSTLLLPTHLRQGVHKRKAEIAHWAYRLSSVAVVPGGSICFAVGKQEV